MEGEGDIDPNTRWFIRVVPANATPTPAPTAAPEEEEEEPSTPASTSTPTPDPTQEPTPAPEEKSQQESLTALTQEEGLIAANSLADAYLRTQNTIHPGEITLPTGTVFVTGMAATNIRVYQVSADGNAIAIGLRRCIHPADPDDWEQLMIANGKFGESEWEGWVTNAVSLIGRRQEDGTWVIPDNSISTGILHLAYQGGVPEDQVVQVDWPLYQVIGVGY